MPPSIRFQGRLLAVESPHARAGQRVGLLGGSFNPPHAAHVEISRTALTQLRLDRVWWLVTPGNPLKSGTRSAPIAERLEQARSLVRDPRIVVTGFESALGSPYTTDTLAFLGTRFPGARFVWLMGADNLARFHVWRDWRAIARRVPIAVIDRPGWHFRALAAPAARALARARVPASRAASLPVLRPPAWVFLTARLSPLSSTHLRSEAAIKQ